MSSYHDPEIVERLRECARKICSIRSDGHVPPSPILLDGIELLERVGADCDYAALRREADQSVDILIHGASNLQDVGYLCQEQLFKWVWKQDEYEKRARRMEQERQRQK